MPKVQVAAGTTAVVGGVSRGRSSSVLNAASGGQQQRSKSRQKGNNNSNSNNNNNNRHEPLGQVLIDDANRNKYATMKNKSLLSSSNNNNNTGIGGEDTYIDDNDNNGKTSVLDAKASKRIMELSKAQQYEIEIEQEQEDNQRRLRQQQQQLKKKNMNMNDNDDDDDDIDDDDDNNNDVIDDDVYVQEEDGGGYVTISDDVIGLGPDDEALVASMMMNGPSTTQKKVTLADLILSKIEQRKNELEQIDITTTNTNNPNIDTINTTEQMSLPPKIIEVYTDIGKVLSRYTAGKLPKAFKVIPSLTNWEEIVYLTRPEYWTPQAMYASTRIFASNLNPKMATRFYNLVLLDACRNDINNNKKLNYHYYMALKKSVYKPASFFRGIVLPLCNDPNCTLREAAIVASVLQRVSIPVHHAAVAIHKLALMKHYTGASSIFIKTLINKKYSLPTPVLSSLVQHFTSFTTTTTEGGTSTSSTTVLPVLWHQSLLVFVQRYKNELQNDCTTREALRKLLKQQFHHQITPEIRRELFGTQQAYKEYEANTTSTVQQMAAAQEVPPNTTTNTINDNDNDDMMMMA